MESLTTFEAKANPLGSEIDLSWEYPETSVSRYKLYVFKASFPIDDDDIKKYLKNPIKDNLLKGIYVFMELEPETRVLQDFVVLEEKTYYYKAILVNLNDISDLSEIKSIEILNPKFDLTIQVIPTKKLVIEGLEKLLGAIMRTKKAKLMVYNEFPLEQMEGAWLVVTRASGELAHRFWSNIIGDYTNELRTGEVDTDMIQVVWETSNNPILRDELTDFFRGTRRFLERFFKHRYVDGVKDVFITMGGDGADTRIPGRHIIYGSMIVSFIIENQMIVPKNNELRKELNLEFNFTTSNEPELLENLSTKKVDDTPTAHEPLTEN